MFSFKCLTGFTVLAAGLISNLSLAATIDMTYKMAADSSMDARIKVEGLQNGSGTGCTADTFKMRIYDENNGGDQGWYVSKSGKSSWNVNSNKCNINQEIAHSLLQEGKALEVVLYKGSSEVDSYVLNIPCANDIVVGRDYQIKGSLLKETRVTVDACQDTETGVVTTSEPQVSGTVVVGKVTTSQSTPPPQSCEFGVEYNENSISLIARSCEYADILNLRISYNGVDLTKPEKLVKLNQNNQVIYSVERSPYYSVELGVQVYSESATPGALLKNQTYTIHKDPTNFYKVNASLIANVLEASQQDGTMFSKSKKFSSTVSVSVSDEDIERDFPTSDILVQLINVRTGKIVEVKAATTGQTVSFNLYGEYNVPNKLQSFFGGSEGWDTSANLQEGANEFIVRVYEAYANELAGRIQDLKIDKSVTVNVRK